MSFLPALGFGPETTAAPPEVTKQSVWDILNKGLDVAQKGTDIFNQIKSGGSGSGGSNVPGYNPNMATTQIQPGDNTPPKKDHTKTIILAVGGAAALATIAYVVTRKKKKGVNGIGDSNSEKKGGRRKAKKRRK